ncbi:Pre-rRNA-processing protein TSR2 [Spathaspora sp. JA1]|nr:Pre-rRNA-processing protein TSR2 [Spathaspora sp. JA1]
MTTIDPTDYVEVETGTLQFSNVQQQGKFELGICMAIYKWQELTIAVENNWGGPKSAEKRDWINGIIIDLFNENQVVDIQLIEETLLYAMIDEFDVEIDNDSALEIANLIMKFYRDVSKLEYGAIDELYSKWEQRDRNQDYKVVVESDPNNPDVSDEEEEEEEHTHTHGDDHDHDMEIDDSGPIVDDDGFELVQRRRR